MQNYFAQTRCQAMSIMAATVICVEVKGRNISCVVQALMPRNVVVGILVIALEFFIGVREVQDKLHATPLSQICRVRCAIVLVINRRRRAIRYALGKVSTLHGTEVGKDLVTCVVRTIIGVCCIQGLLNRCVLLLLVERHRSRISMLQTSSFPQRLAIIYAHIDIRAARICNNQGLVGFGVIAVVVRNIGELVSVAKRNVHAIAVLKAQIIELVDGDVQVAAAKLGLVNCIDFSSCD